MNDQLNGNGDFPIYVKKQILSSSSDKTFTRLDNASNTAGVLLHIRTAYHSRAPGSSSVFW